MSVWDRIADFLTIAPQQDMQTRTVLATPFSEFPDMTTQLANIRMTTARPWRTTTVAEALAVPAIQRAVMLISHTTGMLSMQGFRNGMPMDETPRILQRPDPFQTPFDAYRDMAYGMAAYGETVQWIAKRDSDGSPLALINVPLMELTVEDNPRNRLFPVYTWGDIKSTRYSNANPDGAFVHVTYHREAGALRGVGPLQMCGVALSVSVEAQNWAASFYGGGTPPLIIKSAVELGTDLDPETGLTEAQTLKAGWMAGEAGVPKVIDPGVEEVQQLDWNPQGAQMLDAREANNGDAARMFGVPGALLEYSAPGSSLTYQNRTDLYTDLIRTCLQPYYLEPIEQTMSDLLPRTQIGQFYVDGLLRADVETRYKVYKLGLEAVDPVTGASVLTVGEARSMEGLAPGSIEVAPIMPSPPQAIPTNLPADTMQSRSTQVRCDGKRIRNGVLQPCGKLLADGGSFVGKCPRCDKVYEREPESVPGWP